VNDDGVTLALGPLPECGGCTACGLFAPRKPQLLRAANPHGLALQPGDVVEVGFASGKALRMGFMVLILPLVLFLGAFSAAGAAGVTSEPLKVVAGIVGLAAGFALAWARGRARGNLPEVVRVAPPGALAVPAVCGLAADSTAAAAQQSTQQ
jgi:positive regulator of sigma E activity